MSKARQSLDLGDELVHTQDGVGKRKGNAATGASAAGIRALSAQFVAFYFRAPMKAFFRTRVDYMGMYISSRQHGSLPIQEAPSCHHVVTLVPTSIETVRLL